MIRLTSIVLILCALSWASAADAPDEARELTVIFADVGQGDGAVLRLPNGRCVVIDANAGAAQVMSSRIEALSCTRIFAVVMSHPHVDHCGGLADILARYPVERFYDPGFPHTTVTYRRLLEAVDSSGCDYIVPAVGETLDWDSSLVVTVLHAGGPKAGGVNNASIVLRIAYGDASMIFTGDAEKEAEAEILARFPGALGATLLKVGHHGSLSSTTPGFLAAVGPKVAVISAGAGNSYRHPRQSILDRLSASGAMIYRTDLHGTIRVTTRGDSLIVSPSRSATIERIMAGADTQ